LGISKRKVISKRVIILSITLGQMGNIMKHKLRYLHHEFYLAQKVDFCKHGRYLPFEISRFAMRSILTLFNIARSGAQKLLTIRTNRVLCPIMVYLPVLARY
jgi:hypothetical protein